MSANSSGGGDSDDPDKNPPAPSNNESKGTGEDLSLRVLRRWMRYGVVDLPQLIRLFRLPSMNEAIVHEDLSTLIDHFVEYGVTDLSSLIQILEFQLSRQRKTNVNGNDPSHSDDSNRPDDEQRTQLSRLSELFDELAIDGIPDLIRRLRMLGTDDVPATAHGDRSEAEATSEHGLRSEMEDDDQRQNLHISKMELFKAEQEPTNGPEDDQDDSATQYRHQEVVDVPTMGFNDKLASEGERQSGMGFYQSEKELQKIAKELKLDRLCYKCGECGERKVDCKDGVYIPHYCKALQARVNAPVISIERTNEILEEAQRRMVADIAAGRDPATTPSSGRERYWCRECDLPLKGHECPFRPWHRGSNKRHKTSGVTPCAKEALDPLEPPPVQLGLFEDIRPNAASFVDDTFSNDVSLGHRSVANDEEVQDTNEPNKSKEEDAMKTDETEIYSIVDQALKRIPLEDSRSRALSEPVEPEGAQVEGLAEEDIVCVQGTGLNEEGWSVVSSSSQAETAGTNGTTTSSFLDDIDLSEDDGNGNDETVSPSPNESDDPSETMQGEGNGRRDQDDNSFIGIGLEETYIEAKNLPWEEVDWISETSGPVEDDDDFVTVPGTNLPPS